MTDVAFVPDIRACGPEGLIDDCEDGDNRVLSRGGRGGYWYTFRDKRGTTVTPAIEEDGARFTMSPGGRDSRQAARFHGNVGTGTPLFAGMGVNLTDPKGPYDASGYAGIAFWARAAPGATGKVRLKIPDANTDPQGGVCAECFNDFGADLALTSEWKQFVFPWPALKQLPGWGVPRKAQISRPPSSTASSFRSTSRAPPTTSRSTT